MGKAMIQKKELLMVVCFCRGARKSRRAARSLSAFIVPEK